MPPPSAKSGPVEFAAPVGRRVRVISTLVLAIIPLAMIINVTLWVWQRLPTAAFWPMLLAPLVGLLVLVPVALWSQVLGYRLTADELVIRRRWRDNRIALDGLQGVAVDPGAMAWSMKLLGNDGLGAITGRFRNRRLGTYRAFVTDRDRAVVLRWPDRCLVVSPDRSDEFAAELRRRAGLPT
jgi:hypothetical protein